MNDLIFRQMKEDDAEQVESLCSQLGYSTSTRLIISQFNKINSTDFILVAVTPENLLVGFIHASPYNLLFHDTMVNILGLVVNKYYRGKGIGRRLLAKTEEWALSNNYNTIRINSGIERSSAHEFYLSCHYEKHSDQKRFFKNLT